MGEDSVYACAMGFTMFNMPGPAVTIIVPGLPVILPYVSAINPSEGSCVAKILDILFSLRQS